MDSLSDGAGSLSDEVDCFLSDGTDCSLSGFGGLDISVTGGKPAGWAGGHLDRRRAAVLEMRGGGRGSGKSLRCGRFSLSALSSFSSFCLSSVLSESLVSSCVDWGFGSGWAGWG